MIIFKKFIIYLLLFFSIIIQSGCVKELKVEHKENGVYGYSYNYPDKKTKITISTNKLSRFVTISAQSEKIKDWKNIRLHARYGWVLPIKCTTNQDELSCTFNKESISTIETNRQVEIEFNTKSGKKEKKITLPATQGAITYCSNTTRTNSAYNVCLENSRKKFTVNVGTSFSKVHEKNSNFNTLLAKFINLLKHDIHNAQIFKDIEIEKNRFFSLYEKIYDEYNVNIKTKSNEHVCMNSKIDFISKKYLESNFVEKIQLRKEKPVLANEYIDYQKLANYKFLNASEMTKMIHSMIKNDTYDLQIRLQHNTENANVFQKRSHFDKSDKKPKSKLFYFDISPKKYLADIYNPDGSNDCSISKLDYLKIDRCYTLNDIYVSTILKQDAFIVENNDLVLTIKDYYWDVPMFSFYVKNKTLSVININKVKFNFLTNDGEKTYINFNYFEGSFRRGISEYKEKISPEESLHIGSVEKYFYRLKKLPKEIKYGITIYYNLNGKDKKISKIQRISKNEVINFLKKKYFN